MGRKGILRQYVLMPKGLPKDKPKDYIASRDENEETSLYASKDDLKALKDKFSMVLTQLIKKNNLQK